MQTLNQPEQLYIGTVVLGGKLRNINQILLLINMQILSSSKEDSVRNTPGLLSIRNPNEAANIGGCPIYDEGVILLWRRVAPWSSSIQEQQCLPNECTTQLPRTESS